MVWSAHGYPLSVGGVTGASPPRAAGSRERPPVAFDAEMQGMVGDVTLFCMLTIMLLGRWRRAIVL